MGSWNGTCALSQLPIFDNQKIVLFIIERQLHYKKGRFTYSHDMYRPFSIPIFGEYNDYGGIQNISNEEKDIIFHYLMNSMDYKCSKKDVSKITNLEEFINDYLVTGKFDNYEIMMVLPDIYNAFMNELYNRECFSWYEKDKPELKIKEVLNKHAYVYADKFLKEWNEAKIEYNISEDYLYQNIYDEKDYLKVYIKLNHLHEKIENSFTNYVFGYNTSLKYWKDYFDTEYKDIIIKGLIDVQIFDEGLNLSRKMWIPQSGGGSQGREMFLQKIIAEKIIQIEDVYKDDLIKDNYESFDLTNPSNILHYNNLTREKPRI